MGKFKEPFVPVEISAHYDGYSWANLPTIGQVKVTAGKVLHKDWIGSSTLFCVESLAVEAYCSDGKVYSSTVCMAVKPWEDPKTWRCEDEVYVTSEAREELSDEYIWYTWTVSSMKEIPMIRRRISSARTFRHSGWGFWGPDEPLRDKLVQCLKELKKGWKKVTILPEGQVMIGLADGSEREILPPKRRP